MRGRTFSKVLPRAPFQKILSKRKGIAILMHIFFLTNDVKYGIIPLFAGVCGLIPPHTAATHTRACADSFRHTPQLRMRAWRNWQTHKI